jgi:hypothetical protein
MCIKQLSLRAGKFGGIFASLPQAMVSGIFCIMFGLISAVGISQLQARLPLLLLLPWRTLALLCDLTCKRTCCGTFRLRVHACSADLTWQQCCL